MSVPAPEEFRRGALKGAAGGCRVFIKTRFLILIFGEYGEKVLNFSNTDSRSCVTGMGPGLCRTP